MNKIYAISDIHGCYDHLIRLLKKIPPLQPDDKLIFLGDYIDRGPKSYEVVQHLLSLPKEQTIFLKGNHEDLMLEYMEGSYDAYKCWIRNGAMETIRSYNRALGGDMESEFSLPQEHIDFYNNLKICYETDDYFFVHAGLNPYKPMTEQSDNDMLWIRDIFITSNKLPTDKRVIFGHTPLKKPLVRDNKIGIDTCCFHTGKLTCLELPTEKFYTT